MQRSVRVHTMTWSVDTALLPEKPTPGRLSANGSSVTIEIRMGKGWAVIGELRGPQADRLRSLIDKGVQMHAVVQGNAVFVTWRK